MTQRRKSVTTAPIIFKKKEEVISPFVSVFVRIKPDTKNRLNASINEDINSSINTSQEPTYLKNNKRGSISMNAPDYEEDEYYSEEDSILSDDSETDFNSVMLQHHNPIVAYDEKTIKVEHPHYTMAPFTFDRVFPQTASQTECYEQMGRKLIKEAFDGYDTCLFSYGQSGSGKTYSLYGDTIRKNDGTKKKQVGLMQMIMKSIFKKIESGNVRYRLKLKIVEVFDRNITDLLLNPQKVAGPPPVCKVRNGEVDGAKNQTLDSYKTFCKVFDAAMKRRSRHKTKLNSKASRAHTLCKLTLTRRKGTDGNRTSTISLIDLAGASRVAFTGAGDIIDGDKLTERSGINVSLTTLGKVIMQLTKTKLTSSESTYVSYRDSLLTMIMKNCLGGNSRTSMLVTLTQDYKYLDDSISSLRFAARAKLIKNTPIPHEDSSMMVQNEDLREQLRMLSAALDSVQDTNAELRAEIEKQMESIINAEKNALALERTKTAMEKAEEALEEEKQISKSLKYSLERIENKYNVLSHGHLELEQQSAEQISALENDLDTQKTLCANLAEKYDTLNEEAQRQKVQLEDEASKRKEMSEKEIASLKQQHEKLMNELQHKHQQETSDMIKQHETTLDELQDQLDEVHAASKEAKIAHDEEMERIEAEKQQEINTLKETFEEKEKESSEAQEEAFQELENKMMDDFAEKMKQQQSAHQDSLNQQQTEHDQHVNTLKSDFEKQMLERAKEQQELTDQLQVTLKKQMKEMQDDYESKIKILTSKYDETIEKMEHKFKLEHQQHEMQHQKSIDTLKARYDDETEELKQSHRSMINNQKREAEYKYNEKVRDYEQQIDDLKKKQASQLEKSIHKHKETMKNMEHMLAEHKDTVESLKRRHRDQMEHQKADHDDEIESLKHQHERALAESNRRLNHEKQEAVHALETEISKKKAENEALDKKLKQCSSWIKEQKIIMLKQNSTIMQSIHNIPLGLEGLDDDDSLSLNRSPRYETYQMWSTPPHLSPASPTNDDEDKEEEVGEEM
mmetsp:Transcript_10299/g.15057  ORF Transcript_10299/g.15057 Transcript_10299/m.15057 type:complete len:1021 (-) Transcript_10299:36-3098(-)